MKTVSLELSKQLKANGYPQEGYFYWMKPCSGTMHYSGKGWEFGKLEDWGKIHLDAYLASPTADEILERLPATIGSGTWLNWSKAKNGWSDDCFCLSYERWEKQGDTEIMLIKHVVAFDDPSLADAAAKLWLYLKKEDLL